MIALKEVLIRLGGKPDEPTLEYYISRAWIRPTRHGVDWLFDEMDIARIQLVHELRAELLEADSSTDIVLSLLDQLYGMRHHISRLHQAIETQPMPVREALKQWLEKD